MSIFEYTYRMPVLCRLCTLMTLLSAIVCLNGSGKSGNTVKPNIVMIIADDLGWDDVSYHGSSQVLTPNIDMLAYTGVALERYYTHCVCTPSRAAILTGKFAHTLGMHGYPLTYGEDRGLLLTQKILPEYLKDIGYVTHLVGKWHVGHSREEYLPTSRGFDSHFGVRGGTIDYYEYVGEETWNTGTVSGFDLFRNDTPAWDVKGYLTDVLTDKATEIIKSHSDHEPLFLMVSYNAPHGGNDGAILQAPPETVRSMRHVESPNRRIFAAMTKKLDDGVGNIFKALSEEGMLENTIIVFISDNGGMPIGLSSNYASNWPLRGSKFTPFEGGIRVAGLLWSPLLNVTNHLWKGYFHAVDWIPTLLKAIGAEIPKTIDGINLWDNISGDQSSTRNDFVEIFTYGERSFSLAVSGDYKLIVGNVRNNYSENLAKDLRGIIGSGPEYTDVVKNSEIYRLLKEREQDFDFINLIELRNNIKINCVPIKNNISARTQGTNHYLYNIKQDPCEFRDLSEIHPDILETLQNRLQVEATRTVQRPYPAFRDPRALPCLHNYTWSTWANGL